MRANERHILLVDDDANDLMLLQGLIESIDDDYHYVTYFAHNAGEAVTAYAKNPVECALIDYCMPNTNGIDLIDLLHSLPNHVALRAPFPVIIISGSDDETIQQKTADAEALSFVAKHDLKTPEDVKHYIDLMLDVYQKEKNSIMS